MKTRIPKRAVVPVCCDTPAPGGGVNADAYLRVSAVAGVDLQAVVKTMVAARLLKSRPQESNEKLREMAGMLVQILISEIRQKFRSEMDADTLEVLAACSR